MYCTVIKNKNSTLSAADTSSRCKLPFILHEPPFTLWVGAETRGGIKSLQSEIETIESSRERERGRQTKGKKRKRGRWDIKSI